ncbi:GNAT family N-acetyltransferase [Rothia sp. ZJ932]|uniref:GNAT family N-acetyltransferase n=1 Tax=Rothia sp. ZJ932 TaxID=2810516 RepID=UPI0019682FBB|nr:GNAT family N-acetyltransferase [Rothia sp. ZJ932]QRZ62434.1 GNAT family N-acetyltransferase [Rothia sp. ZJ932]
MTLPTPSAITSYQQVRRVLDAQLEADFCLPAGAIASAFERGKELLTAPRLDLEKMARHRRWWTRSHFEMRLGNYRGVTLLCATHPRVLQEVTQLLSGDAGNWVGDYSKLHRVNDFLSPYALQSSGTALFFTAGRALFDAPARQEPAGYTFTWLTAPLIETFRGDARFANALGFSKDRPDTQVLAAFHGGTPVAIAGASADSQLARQIGIDVLPQHRGKGLASYLVERLAREVLTAGFVPFYGTSPSHILSQKVALNAGFEPGWYEYVSTSLLEVHTDDPADGPEGRQA